MNILVLIKQVPDTEAKITVSGGKVNESGIKWIVAPYDEIALEEAIRIKEKTGATVTAISVGTDQSVQALRTCYAMGADKAILVKTDDYEMLNSAGIADAILKAVEGETYEVILAGRQATDSDNGQVPLIIATKMGIPAITLTNEVTIDGDKVTMVCEMEGGEATYESGFPVLITANDRLNEPRYPSLKGIMASKKKPIDTKESSALGIDTSGKVEVVAYEPPAERPAGKIIDGEEVDQKAKDLVAALREEKVL